MQKGWHMGPSGYVGRVGGLAVALGIGMAVFTAPAVAWAEADSAGGATASDAAPSRGDSPRARRTADSAGPAASARVRSGRGDSPAAVEAATPDVTPDIAPRRSTRANNRLEVPSPAAATPAKPSNALPAKVPAPAEVVSAAAVPTASTAPAPAAVSLPTRLPPALIDKLTPLLQVKPIVPEALPVAPRVPGTVLAKIADRLTTLVNTAVARLADSLANGSPFGPKVESPAAWLLLAFARRQLQPSASTTALAAQNAAAEPALVLNGYNVVATSPLYATSFYGPYASWPGYKGIQGSQEFDLVDPATNEAVGSFSALALYDGTGRPGRGSKLIVVTAVNSGEIGTTAGKVPPVGSVLAVSGGNGVTSGNVYTDMPPVNGEGKYVKQYYAITRFGNLPLFTQYHAAETLTDYQSSNQPVYLTDGFYMAPEVPSSEIFTAVDGLPPLFMVMQGTQTYSLFDENTKEPVGSFEALLTTTSDFFGVDTKMILVTDTGESTNVGTDPGQIPPVGTVYNVVYFNQGKNYLLYESAPTPLGTKVSVLLVTPRTVTPLGFIKFDASTPPPLEKVEFPGGGGTFALTFVPSSPQTQPVGVNGLPPREMITQAYQQFDIYDEYGNKIGNVDAYITRQWDLGGGVQNQIMVVNVNEGTPGIEYNQVPPVGSVYTTRDLFLGLSQVYTARPTPSGDYVVQWLQTPLGNLPLSGGGSAAVNADNVVFFSPFRRELLA